MLESNPGALRCRGFAALLSLSLLAACSGGGGGGGGDAGVGVDNPNPVGPIGPSSALGVPEFTADSFTFDETAGTVAVTVGRFGDGVGEISTNLAVLRAATGASAVENVDFVLETKTVVFAAGDVSPKTVSLKILNDAGNEPVESLTLQLLTSGSTTRNGVTLSSRDRMTVSINDNDPLTTSSSSVETKRLVFVLNENPEATFFRAFRLVPGGEIQVGPDTPAPSRRFSLDLALHLEGPQSEFRIDACNAVGCVASAQKTTLGFAESLRALGYLKASDSTVAASLGTTVAVSGDGSTVAIGAPGVNNGAGAVYVYKRPTDGSAVLARQPVKIAAPSNDPMRFGAAIALNGDGTLLAVGAPGDSNSLDTDRRYPVTPDQAAPASGGVFVYQGIAGASSVTPSYFKAPNFRAQDMYGAAVAMAGDGLTIAIGTPGDDSSRGLGGNSDAPDSGAVSVLTRNSVDEAFVQNLPLKAEMPTPSARFGTALAISNDFGLGQPFRRTQFLVVGAPGAVENAGVAYLFVEIDQGTFRGPPTIIPTSAPARGNLFGASVAISADGSTIVVGAPGESTVLPRTIDGSGRNSGAAFVFSTSNLVNSRAAMPAFLKARTPMAEARYGAALAVSANGSVIAVGVSGDSTQQVGLGGVDDGAGLAAGAGAVEVAARGVFADWSRFTDPGAEPLPTKRYVKASNTEANDRFGTSVALSGDGTTLIVGAPGEDGNNVNFNDVARNEADNTLTESGAAYLY